MGTGIALEVLVRGDSARPETAPDFSIPENITFTPAPELQGQWSMVSGKVDGHALPKAFAKSGRRFVEGNDMSVTFGSEVHSKGRYTVDGTSEPFSIDIYNTGGTYAGKIQQGIYAVEGKTLNISIASPGEPRPRDFTSTPGDGRTVVVWSKSR